MIWNKLIVVGQSYLVVFSIFICDLNVQVRLVSMIIRELLHQFRDQTAAGKLPGCPKPVLH